MSYTYKYPRPSVTVDSIIFFRSREEAKVLLIQRGNPPYKDMWAFPGGFVDMDEDLEDAALRELEEETGLKLPGLSQLHTVGTPGRDPRGRTISVVYVGFVAEANSEIVGGDDAKSARWFRFDEVPRLAFDHNEILDLAIKKLL